MIGGVRKLREALRLLATSNAGGYGCHLVSRCRVVSCFYSCFYLFVVLAVSFGDRRGKRAVLPEGKELELYR